MPPKPTKRSITLCFLCESSEEVLCLDYDHEQSKPTVARLLDICIMPQTNMCQSCLTTILSYDVRLQQLKQRHMQRQINVVHVELHAEQNTCIELPKKKIIREATCSSGGGSLQTRPLQQIAPKEIPVAVDGEHSYAMNTCRSKEPSQQKQPLGPHAPIISFEDQVQESGIFDMMRIMKQSTSKDVLSVKEHLLLAKALDNRNIPYFLEALFSLPTMKAFILQKLASDMHSSLTNRTSQSPQYLAQRDYVDLVNFKWTGVVKYGIATCPDLIQLLLGSCLPVYECSASNLAPILPKLGFLYSIIAQQTSHVLSRTQRLLSTVLYDFTTNKKVFDILKPLGVCLANTYQSCIGPMADQMSAQLKHTLDTEPRLLVLGDCIHLKHGSNHSLKSSENPKQLSLKHAFGAIGILPRGLPSSDLSLIRIDLPMNTAQYSDFLPSLADWEIIRREYVVVIATIARRLLPAFVFLEEFLPAQNSEQKVSEVISLPTLFGEDPLPANETTISQIVQETISVAQFSTRKKTTNQQQDDQATNTSRKFRALEFGLHGMQTQLISIAFKELHTEKDLLNAGTMRHVQEAVGRKQLQSDGCEGKADFFYIFTYAYIAEAILEFFGMKNISDLPQKHLPSETCGPKAKEEWLYVTFGKLVEQFIGPDMQSREMELVALAPDWQMQGQLPSGNALEENRTSSYARVVLQLGLLHHSLLNLVQRPERVRGLALLKMLMQTFLQSTVSKDSLISRSALNIMKFLFNQLCLRSELEAQADFMALFTRMDDGQVVPTDLALRLHLAQMRRHLETNAYLSMYRQERTRVMPHTMMLGSLLRVFRMYERHTGVLERNKTPCCTEGEELQLLALIRQLRPFKQIAIGGEALSLSHGPTSVMVPFSMKTANVISRWLQNECTHIMANIGDPICISGESNSG